MEWRRLEMLLSTLQCPECPTEPLVPCSVARQDSGEQLPGTREPVPADTALPTCLLLSPASRTVTAGSWPDLLCFPPGGSGHPGARSQLASRYKHSCESAETFISQGERTEHHIPGGAELRPCQQLTQLSSVISSGTLTVLLKFWSLSLLCHQSALDINLTLGVTAHGTPSFSLCTRAPFPVCKKKGRRRIRLFYGRRESEEENKVCCWLS
ncbi:uncharacterized protein LOC110345918 [Heterocephalus glaber]|uniref:Uncharacterized protein LOC110345918 n=1 Tax=Heterocephalus glaber TaxID=10181 RepID=A0AAX6RTF8_HETGA|nr:uncharacterized protein LOC110345918 [Heterocephalus glaber]